MSEPEEGELDLFSPANISPLVAYLATEKCPLTGKRVCRSGRGDFATVGMA